MTLYSCLYRKFQQFMHKRDWHHMEKSGPFEDGSRQQWCHWCGLRVTIPPPDPTAIYKCMHALAVTDPRAGIYLSGVVGI